MDLKYDFNRFFKAQEKHLGHALAICLVFVTIYFSMETHASAQSAQESSREVPHPEQLVRPTLLIQTDVDCSFRLDDAPPQRLATGEVKSITTVLGEHVVTAISADRQDSWKMVVIVDQPLQRVIVIELLKMKVARQQAEREAVRLEQEIAAKRKKAQEARAATEKLREQRAESPNQVLPGTGQDAGVSRFAASQPVVGGSLGAGGQLANPKDPQSLVAAANAGQINLVRNLLTQGADVNAAACASHGCTKPLTAAVLSLAEIREMVNQMFEQNRAYLPQFKDYRV